MIALAFLNGKPSAEVDFSITQQTSGPWGLTFTEITSPGQTANITQFNLRVPDKTVTSKINGRRVAVHLIDAPTTCNGAWTFEQEDAFTNVPALIASDSQPCVKR